MQSHEIDYKILGESIQLVEVELDPDETVIAEAGAMVYMDSDVAYETKMGDGSNPSEGFFGKLVSAGTRMLTGESAFMTHFTNRGVGKAHIGFAAPYPGTIVPVNLSQYNASSIVVQKDSFLCAALGTKVSIRFNKRIGSGLVGGEGFILQQLQGDGMAFIHAGGTIVERELQGETIKVDTGCVVGFEEGIDFDVSRAGSIKSMIFGGEGLFLANLSGHGKVWLQSMPMRKLVQALAPYGSNRNKGGSSVLGEMFSGD